MKSNQVSGINVRIDLNLSPTRPKVMARSKPICASLVTKLQLQKLSCCVKRIFCAFDGHFWEPRFQKCTQLFVVWAV